MGTANQSTSLPRPANQNFSQVGSQEPERKIFSSPVQLFESVGPGASRKCCFSLWRKKTVKGDSSVAVQRGEVMDESVTDSLVLNLHSLRFFLDS